MAHDDPPQLVPSRPFALAGMKVGRPGPPMAKPQNNALAEAMGLLAGWVSRIRGSATPGIAAARLQEAALEVASSVHLGILKDDYATRQLWDAAFRVGLPQMQGEQIVRDVFQAL